MRGGPRLPGLGVWAFGTVGFWGGGWGVGGVGGVGGGGFFGVRGGGFFGAMFFLVNVLKLLDLGSQLTLCLHAVGMLGAPHKLLDCAAKDARM